MDPLNVTAMACPALPLCPLAITEAERGIPDILKRVRAVFEKVFTFQTKQVHRISTKNLTDKCSELTFYAMRVRNCINQEHILFQVGLKYNESVVIRVTGCPNGCSRPYMAELGFVGDGPNSYQVYRDLRPCFFFFCLFCANERIIEKHHGLIVVFKQIWLGGTPNQTALARSFMNKVKVQDLENVLEPLFYHWKQKRQSKESFGDFTTRMVSIEITALHCNL